MKVCKAAFSLLMALLIVMQTANAQPNTKAVRKPNPAKTSVVVKEDIPPPMEMMQPSNPITFDTTAVVEDSFTADIRQLMNGMQFKENLVKTVSSALEQNTTQLPVHYRSSFKEKFMREFTGASALGWMENLFIKNYRKSFTQSEIRELIQFYETSLGKKFIDKSPELTSNIMQDSQKIGEYIGYKVGQEISNEQSKK
jgi:hypothetical protein